MNLKEKIIILVQMIIVILVTNFMVLFNSVKAVSVTDISQVDLKSGGYCGKLLKRNGIVLKTYYVEYTHDGKSYPAYCLDQTLHGVSDELSYFVTPNGKINDLALWRIIINGYPYKTISELGVANKEEAFAATKQAIYCHLCGFQLSDYEAIGEAGERTLNALYKIVTNAQNSTETQATNTIEIKAENKEWIEDEKDSKYLYKVYSVSSNASNLDYEIEVIDEMPEGSKIVKVDGTESKKFSSKEKFKVMLLKDNLTKDGKFKLNIKTEVKTKPVIYGASPNAEWQNYALTAYMYEDCKTVLEDTYKKQEKPKVPEKPKTPETPKSEEPKVKILPVTGM